MATADLRRRLDRVDVEDELRATATFPVVELPVEITTEIFGWCLPIPETPASCVYYFPHVWERMPPVDHNRRLAPRAPLTFASVCRRWRDIALSTPKLWSRIEYYFPPDINLQYASQYFKIPVREADEIIALWLSRAGSLPLSIHLRTDAVNLHTDVANPLDDSSTLNRVRDLIYRYSNTIQHLELRLSIQIMRHLDLDSCRFPLLRSVSLGVEQVDDDDDPVHVFSDAPLLHKLFIPTYGANILPFYTLPWLQLTKFDGMIYSMDLFISAPNLTEVICVVTKLLDEPASVITHTHLQSLTLKAAVNMDGS
ncbi:hypothetical protein FB451DRAFT_1404623 [Mycena latifolia]|nr:hypothetical protein FB451DRAFT_1404623 [Mycena latifolia]